jgi:predicted transcriptional regulator
MTTCKEEILKFLRWSPSPRAVHEFAIDGYSQNNIATRLNELEREGLLKSDYREGTRYKQWALQKADGDQLLMGV